MAKKKANTVIPIIGEIGGEVQNDPKQSNKLIEFIAKDNAGKYEKDFVIDSVKPIEGEQNSVSVLVYFDNKSWARRYVVDKGLVE
jgi:hypothetical protein